MATLSSSQKQLEGNRFSLTLITKEKKWCKNYVAIC